MLSTGYRTNQNLNTKMYRKKFWQSSNLKNLFNVSEQFPDRLLYVLNRTSLLFFSFISTSSLLFPFLFLPFLHLLAMINILCVASRLSQRNESRGSVTGSSVSNWSVGNRELTQVVSNHLRLDLNGVENLTVVDTNQRANHLRNNNHVSQVSLNNGRLLVSWSSQLSSSQLGNQAHRLGAQTSGESSSNSSAAELGEFLSLQLQQLGEVDALKGEGLESSLPGGWMLVWSVDGARIGELEWRYGVGYGNVQWSVEVGTKRT